MRIAKHGRRAAHRRDGETKSSPLKRSGGGAGGAGAGAGSGSGKRTHASRTRGLERKSSSRSSLKKKKSSFRLKPTRAPSSHDMAALVRERDRVRAIGMLAARPALAVT